MKKIFGFSLLMISCFLLTGCFGSKKDIIKDFKRKYGKLKSYHIKGTLQIMRNEDLHNYNIDVSYKKDDNYRVSLKNKTNNHEQIILKNEKAVYVLTPTLNKSFKFQSEWPYNNSESYLPQILVDDINKDKNIKVKKGKTGYIITTKVDYPNNTSLIKQRIYLDKNANLKKVEVLNNEGIVKIKMIYKDIDKNAKFSKKYFNLEENMNVSKTTQTIKEIDNIIYPMYMPKNTFLESQDTIKTKDGERVILTFKGDSPFMIVEETVKNNKDNMVIQVSGDPELMVDAVGSVSKNSASWISNGIEYYAVSKVLNSEQLLEVVNSISSVPIGK